MKKLLKSEWISRLLATALPASGAVAALAGIVGPVFTLNVNARCYWLDWAGGCDLRRMEPAAGGLGYTFILIASVARTCASTRPTPYSIATLAERAFVVDGADPGSSSTLAMLNE
jgi:hypothetical protein